MDPARRITYMPNMTNPKSDGRVTFSQLGGFRGLIRNPGLVLFTLRRGGHVGADALGNQYYERRGTVAGARVRRWVVYAGTPDASCIGPDWHAWLHYLTDAPLPDAGKYSWELPHQPNFTGTGAGYRPSGHDYEGGKRQHASGDYEAWTPDL
jgi:NADH:ubiquinone oxidoreductase subunit